MSEKERLVASVIFAIFVGFLLGIYVQMLSAEGWIEETIRALDNDWVETQNYLVIAADIKEGDIEGALEFSDGLVKIGVKGINEKEDPSEYELSLLKKVSAYENGDYSLGCECDEKSIEE